MSRASVAAAIGGQPVRIQVAEDLAHRAVIIDDIAANFFRRVGWITIPILLALLAIDIVIFRRAVAPLLRASEEASQIGPARTDIRLPTAELPSEIRPLAVLRTRVETLGDKSATGELLTDIKAMSRIVGQLLEIAELDTLDLDPHDTADLRAVCAEVVGAIAPYALAHGKEIALKGEEAPVAVRGNADMLQRAIFNLAENAIKYTAPNMSVDVEIGGDGAVRVRDRGPGIRPSEQALIFQRFWRGDHRHIDGAGLGLSIVREVADDHAATVAVENLPAGGAQFTLRFKLASEAPAAAMT